VYDTKGKGAVITSTSDMSPGGATQLYLDDRFEEPIVRQLSVKEAHDVMVRPFRIDTSEKDRTEKLRLIGQSEDGELNRAWARKIKTYIAQETQQSPLMADGPLNWTNTEAHVRCLHYGDWCLDLLGLKKLGNPCKECGLSGQKRSKKSTNRQQPVSSVNYRWGCDIIGKMHPKEKGRSKLQYALVVVDYYTGHCWTRSYHSKAETLSKFKEIMKQARHEMTPDQVVFGRYTKEGRFANTGVEQFCKDHKIKAHFPAKLRTDADAIFKSEAFQRYCSDKDVDLEYASPGDQFFNGKVEHLIGVMKIKMHTVLKASGLGMDYWSEALEYCVYTYNRLPSKANSLNCSPYQMYHGKPPYLGHLRGFGCTCTY
jgi:transposase InsO family protein